MPKISISFFDSKGKETSLRKQDGIMFSKIIPDGRGEIQAFRTTGGQLEKLSIRMTQDNCPFMFVCSKPDFEIMAKRLASIFGLKLAPPDDANQTWFRLVD